MPVTASVSSDQTTCKGGEVILTASGGSTYSWSTGEDKEAITVSPNETTTYSVTVSDGLTSDTDDVTVTVRSVQADAGSDVTITEGEEVTLTATGGDTFTWSTGEKKKHDRKEGW